MMLIRFGGFDKPADEEYFLGCLREALASMQISANDRLVLHDASVEVRLDEDDKPGPFILIMDSDSGKASSVMNDLLNQLQAREIEPKHLCLDVRGSEVL